MVAASAEPAAQGCVCEVDAEPVLAGVGGRLAVVSRM